jgi:hypothetical protein
MEEEGEEEDEVGKRRREGRVSRREREGRGEEGGEGRGRGEEGGEGVGEEGGQRGRGRQGEVVQEDEGERLDQPVPYSKLCLALFERVGYHVHLAPLLKKKSVVSIFTSPFPLVLPYPLLFINPCRILRCLPYPLALCPLPLSLCPSVPLPLPSPLPFLLPIRLSVLSLLYAPLAFSSGAFWAIRS